MLSRIQGGADREASAQRNITKLYLLAIISGSVESKVTELGRNFPRTLPVFEPKMALSFREHEEDEDGGTKTFRERQWGNLPLKTRFCLHWRDY